MTAAAEPAPFIDPATATVLRELAGDSDHPPVTNPQIVAAIVALLLVTAIPFLMLLAVIPSGMFGPHLP